MFKRKPTDLEIKEGILKGDLKIYKYLDKQFRAKTVAHVKSNTGNEHDADALYNDVIWQIYQNIEDGKYEVLEGKFGGYFTCIMQNKWKDVLRYRHRKRQIYSTELTPVIENNTISEAETILVDKENSTRTKSLYKHLAELKDQDQLLIKLFYFENLKQIDIAEKIGVTADYVKQRMHTIRRRLKADLNADVDFSN